MTASIDVKIRPEAVKEIIEHMDDILVAGANVVKEEAKKAVSPGVGPGPHPHVSAHVDTGMLSAAQTTYGPYSEGKTRVVEVGGDGSVNYGKFLELGWHSPAGNFWRYPWLWPSLERSIGRIRRLIRERRF